jgi:hypothetical protein
MGPLARPAERGLREQQKSLDPSLLVVLRAKILVVFPARLLVVLCAKKGSVQGRSSIISGANMEYPRITLIS